MSTSESIQTGIALGKAGMERAARAADSAWKADAWQAILTLCRDRREFPAYAMWDYVDPPRDMRASGALWRRAQHKGLIENTGKTVRHPRRHGVRTIVWRAL